jgi:hypothetical protein
MFPDRFLMFWRRGRALGPARPTLALVLLLSFGGCSSLFGESVSTTPKHIIGATATLTEMSTGFSFKARIDTGAKTCSLDVEKVEVENELAQRGDNVGKPIRFLLKNKDGESQWIESTIAGAVRVRSSAQTDGKFDHRYKVRLTLKWKNFRKEVLVSLNDRTGMNYPLLIGRNYLRDDFVVDVSKNNPD